MSGEISAFRTFFTARLRELDPDFKPYAKAFTDDQVGEHNIDRSWQLTYGPSTNSTANQTTTQDDWSVQIDLYFKLNRDDTDKLDAAMDFANLFRVHCMKPKYVRTEPFIKRVFCTGVTPVPMPTNDQSFKLSLTFSIRTVFGVGENFACS